MTNFDNIPDDARIILHPLPDNPIHKSDVAATYVGGYFYCDGYSVEDPDQ